MSCKYHTGTINALKGESSGKENKSCPTVLKKIAQTFPGPFYPLPTQAELEKERERDLEERERERGAAPALEERFHYLAHWRVESDRAGRWKHKSTAYGGRSGAPGEREKELEW
jgi:hypothetical protein